MAIARNSDRLMDLRTIKRNIASGLITKEQVREHLETLPDVSDKLEVMTIPDEDDDDDYDDDEVDEVAPTATPTPETPAS